jgi:FkbM family methyltransferase
LPEIEKNGIKIKLRKCVDDEAVIQEVFEEDVYRVHEIPKGSLVIDLGAHIGTFTLRCAKERDCFVYAYEPNPHSYDLLVGNIKLNHLESKVKAFNVAVGKSCRMRSFCVYDLQHGSSFSPDRGYDKLEQIQVRCVNPRAIFQANKISTCDLLKIDIELAEKEIFTDEFVPYLARAKYIILEWHNYDGAFYAEYLKKMGYLVSVTGCGCPAPPYDPTFARGMLYARQYQSGGISVAY